MTMIKCYSLLSALHDGMSCLRYLITKLLMIRKNSPSKASLLMRIRALEENILASMDSRFSIKLLVHGMGLLLLKFCQWLYLDKIYFKISVLQNIQTETLDYYRHILPLVLTHVTIYCV